MSQEIFKSYAVISTEYILPSAAIISCGGKLHDYKTTHEEPCIRMAVKNGSKTDIKTIFQFREMTSKNEHVKKLLAAYKQIDFGEPCALPENHILRVARAALVERNRLHLLFQKLMEGPVSQGEVPQKCYGTQSTKLAAILSALGHKILAAQRAGERNVFFFFEDSPEVAKLAAAFAKPWGQYDLHEDHQLYHMKGGLENRESLIVLLKNASVRVEVKQGGKRFFLPLNASKEKLTEMVSKLNQ